jgi:hypothetical protein
VRARTLICLLTVAAVATVGVYEMRGQSRPKHYRQLSYTTTDIVEFLSFAEGHVAADHPSLSRPKGDSIKFPRPELLRSIADSVTGCIRSIDAAAGPALTESFNATDPQRLDSAVRRFNDAAKRWLATPYAEGAPCPPPPPPPSTPPHSGGKGGDGFWKVNGKGYLDWLLVGVVAVGAGVSATVGAVFHLLVLAMGTLIVAETAVVILWLWPALVSYQFENPPSDLDRQTGDERQNLRR